MGIHDLGTAELAVLPDDFPPGPLFTAPPFLARLRAERPVCPVVMPSGNRLWLVTRYADVREVMVDPVFSRELTFPGAPRMAGEDLTSVPGSLFNLENADHDRVRKPLARYFNRAAIAAWGDRVRLHANELLDQVEGSAELVSEFCEPLVARLAGELLGIDADEYEWVQGSIRRQLNLEGTPEEIAAASDEIVAFSGRLAERSRGLSNPVAALVGAADRGEISMREAVATTSLLLMNVTDPLIPPLTTGPLTLLAHPEQLAACLADRALWPEAVAEILRYHNNGITNFPRVALADTELAGVAIAKGEGVITSNLAASHDPERFADPDRFDVHRGDKGTIFFGAGAHFCLGAAFAPVVLATAYEALFTRFPDLRVATDPHAIPRGDGGFFARPKHLPVEVG
ncbi:cytochrome P450 [Amycolatopsis silviterrae]|uniref:Cytochrome P450 n=1 Tax=Amycolatopsis silviterrae TaxID=1656914 RepID=A0ABW5H3A8_9PSEU